jgi:hypothetical protein
MIEKQGMLSFVILLAGLLVIVAVMAWLVYQQRHQEPPAPRIDARIPERERELLGDDWRDKAGL